MRRSWFQQQLMIDCISHALAHLGLVAHGRESREVTDGVADVVSLPLDDEALQEEQDGQIRFCTRIRISPASHALVEASPKRP